MTTPIRVYLADDHRLLREGLASLLNKSEHIEVCGQAADGALALEDIQSLKPDVAILDHSMPKLKGTEVIQALRDAHLEIPCLILSSYSQPMLIADAFRKGAHGFLIKESAFSELESAVQTLHKGQHYMSESIDAASLREANATLPVTPRERDVLILLIQGKSASEIGSALSISPRTVETYRSQLASKFGAKNSVDLVRLALEAGYGS